MRAGLTQLHGSRLRQCALYVRNEAPLQVGAEFQKDRRCAARTQVRGFGAVSKLAAYDHPGGFLVISCRYAELPTLVDGIGAEGLTLRMTPAQVTGVVHSPRHRDHRKVIGRLVIAGWPLDLAFVPGIIRPFQFSPLICVWRQGLKLFFGLRRIDGKTSGLLRRDRVGGRQVRA